MDIRDTVDYVDLLSFNSAHNFRKGRWWYTEL